ncbi:MAG: hypothetical protein HY098_03780 [Nitrospinae bacterium]|nr:hypothetical protein [Nitrospinota bacterium]
MGGIYIPAVHLPHGAEVFRTLNYRRSQYRKILKALSERALLGCSARDAIVLPAAPDPGYLDFLLERGLGTREIIVCRGEGGNFAEDVLNDWPALERIRQLAPSEARFYVHLEEEEALAREVGLPGTTTNPALTRLFNALYFLIRLEEDLELDAIPRVQARSSRLDGVLEGMLERHQKLFVRGNESCGGSQAFVLRDKGDVLAMSKKVARNRFITRYFASKFIEGAEGWNFQFILDGDGGSAFYGASRQVLGDGYVHEGNEGGGGVPDGGMELSEKLAGRISEMGGKGFFGADVVMDGEKAYPAELNMRENTSTPVLAAQKKLDAPFFKTVKISAPRGLTFKTVVEMVGEENLLDPGGKSGFLPFNLSASGLTGSLDVAIFGGSRDEVQSRLERLNRAR